MSMPRRDCAASSRPATENTFACGDGRALPLPKLTIRACSRSGSDADALDPIFSLSTATPARRQQMPDHEHRSEAGLRGEITAIEKAAFDHRVELGQIEAGWFLTGAGGWPISEVDQVRTASAAASPAQKEIFSYVGSA